MRIRPSLRLARAAAACVVAAGLGAASNAWSQSLIEALSTTYNSNPDLLASRALLRQTDESLAQAVANWRPRVTLSLEYNKIEQDSYPIRTAPTFFILNGKFTTLDDDPADLPRRQDRRRDQDGAGQHPGPARRARRHRAERAAGRRDVLRRPGAEHRHRRCPPQQRARADPAVGRHARALPRRRAHHHRRLTGRGAPRRRARRPGAGRDAGAHRRGGVPAHHRPAAGAAGRDAADRRPAGERGGGDLARHGHGPARRVGAVSDLGRDLQRQHRRRRPAAPGQPGRRRPAAVRPAGPDRPLLHLRRSPAGDGADLPERQRMVAHPPGQGAGRPAPQRARQCAPHRRPRT